MRIELIKEMKSRIESYIQVDYNNSSSTFFEPYPTADEDDYMAEEFEPQEIFNKDGIIATIEWELGDVYIEGLTPDEINAIKGGEI